MLPRKISKPAKRSRRWRSISHCNFVRGHVCSKCGSDVNIEVAHVRLGSHAGLSQKPHDYRTLSLCAECHRDQHSVGERTFWAGIVVEDIIEAFCKASPKAAEIRKAKAENE